MSSKIHYSITTFLLLVFLISCDLFTPGLGNKVDIEDPKLTVDTPVNGEYIKGVFTLSGTVSDDTSVAEVKITYPNKIGNTVTTLAALSDNKWTINIDSSNAEVFIDGEIEFDIIAKDSANKTSSKNRILYFDNTAPTVLVSSPSNQDIVIVNGLLNVGGTAYDQMIDRVEVYLVSEADPSKKYGGAALGTGDWTYQLDTLALGLGSSVPEAYYLEVIAYDKAGNINPYYYYKYDLSTVSSSLGVTNPTIVDLAKESNRSVLTPIQRKTNTTTRLKVNIDQNADIPKIILPDWDLSSANNYKAFSSEVFLSGRITDDDGLSSVVLSVYNAKNNLLIKQGTADAASSRSYNLEVALESDTWTGYTMTPGLTNTMPEALYYFTITAKDISGESKGVVTLQNNAYFGIDKTAPSVKITSPTDSSFFANSFTVSGTYYDAVGVTSLSLYVDDADMTNPLPVTLNSNGTWSYTVPKLNVERSVYIKAVAFDGSGKSSAETVGVVIDGSAPVMAEKNVVIPSKLNETVKIQVTATDKNLDKVQYKIDAEEWKTITEVDGFTRTITLDTTPYSTGVHVLYLKAMDNAGNTTELAKNITIDQNTDKPEIIFKTPTLTSSSFAGTVNFWLELKDDDKIDTDSIVFEIKKSGSPVALGSYSLTNAILDEDETDPVTLKYSHTFTSDGEYIVSVSVKDSKTIGTVVTSDVVSIPFIMDSNGPIVTIDPIFDSTQFKNSSFLFNGTAFDEMTSISELKIIAKFSTNAEEDIYILHQGDITLNNWSQTISVDKIPDGSDGSLTISVSALDDAGNSSGLLTKNLIIDKAKPVLSSNLTSATTNLNGVSLLSGDIEDNYLESVKVSTNGTDYSSVTSGTYSWKYNLFTKLLTTGAADSTFYVKAIDKAKNEIIKTYPISINQETDKPQFIFDKPFQVGGTVTTNLFGENSTASGTITDDDGVDRTSIFIKVFGSDGTTELSSVNYSPASGGSDKSIPWEQDLSSLPQGVYYIQVLASDDLGNKISGDVVSSNISEKTIFALDFGSPTLEISSPSNATSEITYLNDEFTISGNVKDGLGVKNLKYQLGSNPSVNIFDNKSYTDFDWSKTFTLAQLKTAGTSFNIKLTATDITGKITVSTLPIIIDEAGPIVNISTPLNNSVNDTLPVELSGTILDLGAGFKYPATGDISDVNYDLAYTLDDGTTYTPIELTAGDSSWSYDLGGLSEGSYSIKFKAEDRIGNSTVTPLTTFYYDISNPELTETNSTFSEDEVITNTNITFGGNVSDTNQLKELRVSKNGGTSELVTNNSGPWSYTLDTDGKFNLKFIATDVSGKKSEIIRNIVLDKVAPNQPLITSSFGNYVSSTLNISGTASDNSPSSGLSVLKYSIGNETYDKTITNGGANWFDNIDISNLTENEYTINVKSYDTALNSSIAASKTFTIDKNNPVLTITNGSGGYKTSNFTISGTVTDTYKLGSDPVSISVKKDSADIDLTGYLVDYNSSTGVWSQTIPTDVGDGVYVITVTAKDFVGRDTVKDVTFTVDSTPPDAEFIDLYTALQKTELNGAVHFKGNASDNFAVSKVEIAIVKSDVAVADVVAESWVTLSTLYNWDYWWNSSDKTDQDWKAYLRVTDAAGNISTAAIPYEFTTLQSADAPKITVSNRSLNPTASKYVVDGDSLTGTVYDDDAVDTASVQISFDGTNWVNKDDAKFTVAGTGNTISWSYDISSIPEGLVNLYLKASDDLAVKNASHGFTFAIASTSITDNSNDFWIDRGAPVISDSMTVTTLSGDRANTPLNTSLYIDENFTLKGSALDGNEINSMNLVYSFDDGITWSDTQSVIDDNFLGWEKDVVITTLQNGELVLKLLATDEFGKTGTITKKLQVDITPPVVTLNNPSDSTSLNGIIDVDGSTSDSNSQIVKVEYSFKKNPSGSDWIDISDNGKTQWKLPTLDTLNPDLYIQGTYETEPSDPVTGDFIKLNSSEYKVYDGSSWVLLHNGTKWLPNINQDIKAYLKLRVTDSAGNTNFIDDNGAVVDYSIVPVNGGLYTFTINHFSDKPVILLSNVIEGTEKENSGNNLLESYPKLFGSISDDDYIKSSDVKISFDNGATWKDVSVSGGVNFNWTYNLFTGESVLNSGIVEGDNSFILKVFDENYTDTDNDNDPWYNYATSEQSWFAIDLTSPTLTIDYLDEDGITSTTTDQVTTNLQGKNINKDYYIIGTASDPNLVDPENKIEINIDDSVWVAIVDDNDFSIVSNDGNGNIVWKYFVDTATDISYEAHKYSFRVTDRFNKISTADLNLTIDTKAPVISVSSIYPLIGTKTVNGEITFTSSATDPNGLEDVKYWVLEKDAAQPNWDTADSKVFTEAPYEDVIDTTSLFNDPLLTKDYKIWVIARDKAGNDGIVSKEITIDQASDKPVLQFSNLDSSKNAEITINGVLTENLFLSGVKLIGSVEDDDAVNADSLVISFNGNSYKRVSSAPTGNTSKIVSWNHQVPAEDIVEGNNYFKLKVSDKNSLEKISEKIYFVNDSANPVVTVNEPLQSAYVNGVARTSGEAYDGNIDTFTITANNSSTTSKVTFNGATGTDDETPWGLDFTETTGDFYWDTVNKKYIWDFALEQLPDAYENTPITISYEANDKFGKNTKVDRSVTVDSKAPTVEIQYPTLDSVVTGSVTIKGVTVDEKMTKVEILLGNKDDSVPTNWETLSGTYNWSKTINTVAPAIYELGTNMGDGTYQFPVKIRATDAAGNVTTVTNYQFYISPDLDKPTVSVTTPANNSKLGGAILMLGTATDNEAVSKVYVRIDVNGDGDYTDAFNLDGTDATHMFDNESVWNEITSFANNVWDLEINSDGLLYEENANITGHTGFINVQFKAVDIKGVESLLVTRRIDIDSTFPEITKFQVVGDIVDVSGEITLEIDTKDDGGGIEKIEISYNGGITYEPIYVNGGTAPVTHTMTHPVNTITDLGYSNSSDIVNFRLKVTDNNATPYQSFMSLQLNVDNIKPLGSYTGRVDDIGTAGGNPDGTGAEKRVLISGIFEDKGLVNSFGKVEAYISQDGVIIDPKTGATSTNITKDFNDGNGSVVYPDNSKDIITIDPTAAALERGKDDEGDNDGYYEYISVASGVYNWSAEFDTSKINTDNGAVELHYVLYDKAGNASHYVEIMLIVGSDLDANESVDDYEKMAYPQEFQARSGLLYIELFNGSKAGYHIEVSDTNGSSSSYTGGVLTTASDTTAATINTSSYPNGEVTYTIKVYEGATLKLTKNLVANMKGADEIPPTINVGNLTPSSVVNSSSEVVGHFDYGESSSEAPAIPNADANDYDISGTVKFTGVAKDDTRIKDITLYITGETPIVLAQWDGGLFKSVDSNFVIENQQLHWKDGHTVNFTYQWDTETITGIANTNRVVEFVINDFAVDENSLPTHTVKDIDQFDIVPYITTLETSLNTIFPSKPSAFNRSALGKYPVAENSNITINGFNLSTAADSIEINGVRITATSGTTKKLIANIGSTVTSGDLNVYTNGVKSINNSNSNSEATNQESNNLNNNTLTDDRNIYVWSFSTIVDSLTLTDPKFKMDNASNWYMTYGNNNSYMYFNKNGTLTELENCYNKYHNTEVAFDASGNIYGAATNTDRITNEVSGATSFTFFSRFVPGNTWHYSTSSGKRRIELSYNDSTGIYNIDRVERPSMVAKGSGTDADPARIYMSYFDANNNTSPVKFRYSSIGSNSNSMTGGLANNIPSNNPGSATGFQIVADSTTTYKGGAYSDVDATSTGIAVIAWYDATNRQLVYSYNTDPSGSSQAQWQTNAIVIDSYLAGTHVDLTVDSKNGIHIAYNSTASGDLKYAYLSTYEDTSPEVVTVDSFLTTGTNIMINTRLESDKDVPYISYYQPSFGENRGSVKVAWRNNMTSLLNGASSDYFTGNWEIITVPNENIATNSIISNGVPTSGAYSGKVFLGYYTDSRFEGSYIK
ncbi:MAG: hypothetical protein JXR64_04910 [Spirochaetales bacterium]|nr:hypothetical protein [Spirochaetales bacterium]